MEEGVRQPDNHLQTRGKAILGQGWARVASKSALLYTSNNGTGASIASCMTR